MNGKFTAKSQVALGRVRPPVDDFGGGLAGDGPMHFVLHRPE